MGSALSGEIKIITDSGLSRNWAQVFREAWLSQPTTWRGSGFVLY